MYVSVTYHSEVSDEFRHNKGPAFSSLLSYLAFSYIDYLVTPSPPSGSYSISSIVSGGFCPWEIPVCLRRLWGLIPSSPHVRYLLKYIPNGINCFYLLPIPSISIIIGKNSSSTILNPPKSSRRLSVQLQDLLLFPIQRLHINMCFHTVQGLHRRRCESHHPYIISLYRISCQATVRFLKLAPRGAADAFSKITAVIVTIAIVLHGRCQSQHCHVVGPMILLQFIL